MLGRPPAPGRAFRAALSADAIPEGFCDRASAHEAEAPSSSRRVHFAPRALIVRI